MPETQSTTVDKTEASTTEGDFGLDALFNKTFAPKAAVAQAEPAKPAEAAKQAVAATPEKPRASLLDKAPSVAEPAKPVVEDADPFAGVKDGDWKAAKAASKARIDAAKAQVEAERQEKAKLASEYEATKKTLDEYRTKVPDTEEVARIRKEHKELADKIGILDYQSHPEYRQKFVGPKNKLIAEAKQILTDGGIVDDIDVARLTEKPRAEFAKAVSEIAEKLNDFDANEFRTQMRDLQKLSQAEKEALSSHGEKLAQLNETGKAKQRAAFEDVIGKVSLPAFAKPQDIGKDDPPEVAQLKTSYNDALKSYRKEAEQLAFGVSNESDAAKMAVEAANYRFFIKAAFPLMQADYEASAAEVKALRAKVESLTAVKHSDGADKGSKQTQVKKTFDQAIAETFNR